MDYRNYDIKGASIWVVKIKSSTQLLSNQKQSVRLKYRLITN